MQIEHYRSQFSVAVLLRPQFDSVAEALTSAGYEVYRASGVEEVGPICRDKKPHIVLFDIDLVAENLAQHVSKVLDISPETLIQFIGPADQFGVLSQYREFGLSQYISLGDDLDARAVWLVDSTCESLYLKYQNEQIYDQLQVALDSAQKAVSVGDSTAGQRQETPAARNINVLSQIALYSTASSKDDLLNQFMQLAGENLGSSKGIFFKYLPTAQSLVATHSMGLNTDEIRGVGCQLDFHEHKKFEEIIRKGEIPQSLEKVLRQAFSVAEYEAKILQNYAMTEGLFIVWPTSQAHQLADLWSLFTLNFKSFLLEKRIQEIEIFDNSTDLFNRNYYLDRLQAEVARARRIEKPVSVAKLRIDNWEELMNSVGEVSLRIVMSTIASVIKKTSRVNDYAFRISDQEIAMILPHAGRKGAAIRSERLRRTIEQLTHSQQGFRVTMSFGVSEYPSLSSSAQNLDESATVAMDHIAKLGGNKVCLFKAPENFKADFQVSPL
jgi:diguanylate cyclase (GGDEF)-like protein